MREPTALGRWVPANNEDRAGCPMDNTDHPDGNKACQGFTHSFRSGTAELRLQGTANRR